MNRKSQTPQQVGVPLAAGAAAAALVAVTILAASSLGSYVIPGSGGSLRAEDWPQPIGWIVQVLVVDSWPTYRGVEIRWLAWALGNLGLVGIAAAVGRHWLAPSGGGRLWRGLLGLSAGLVILVGIRAVFSHVPAVGFAWTWQLALALCWMLVAYFWAERLPVEVLARAIALALAVLAAISLLYVVQGRQRFPGWPTGNVLLLTSACMSGVLIAGSWAYGRLTRAMESGLRRDWLGGLSATVLFVVMAAALSMAGRRAGVLGLLAGGAFIVLLRFVRARRARLGVLVLVALAGVASAVAMPYLFRAGRWETVLLRAELYKRGVVVLFHEPWTFWIGRGPGHMGFDLTTLMRPLYAASPRLFHGEIAEQVHSEPLQGIVELGAPLGLLYVGLMLGGLVGYAVAYRHEEADERRVMVLGLGAALAAVLAAESTSVGMRHPGVSALVWALVGIGWACGGRVGMLEGLLARVTWTGAGQTPPGPARKAAALAVGVVLAALSGWTYASSVWLNSGMAAWNFGRSAQGIGDLERARLLPGAGHWMMRQYLLGRANLSVAQKDERPGIAAAARAQAARHLERLAQVSPGYMDTAVWLGRAWDAPEQLAALAGTLLEMDPYDQRARVALAVTTQDPAVRLEHLRRALRNGEIRPELADLIAGALAGPSELDLLMQRLALAALAARGPARSEPLDPLGLSKARAAAGWYLEAQRRAEATRQARRLFEQWLAAAEQALAMPDAAAWPDPLALETMRMAVVLDAHAGAVAQAAAAADRAAVLNGYLRKDPWRRRPEAVELETCMNQAWFGFLVRPAAWRQVLAVLEQRAEELISGPAENLSGKMASEFLAMLHLMGGAGSKAYADLLVAEGPSAQMLRLRRLSGLAYARLVGLLGPRVAPGQVQAWAGQGRQILTDAGWEQAVQQAGRMPLPWWQGVLPGE